MAHSIGSKVWFKGDEVTVTTNAYSLYGGVFQDAIDAAGNIVTLATPEHIEDSVNKQREDWKNQQEQFRRLVK
jgi:hypothetical protein